MGSLSETISPSLRVRDPLDEVLDRFERARLDGEPLKIEDVLGQLAPGDVANVIGLLVEIDAEYRLDSLEEVSLQRYCERFPDHAAAVEEALRRLGEGREGLEPRFRLRHGVRLGDMVVGNEVGRGGVAVVYRVIDGALRRPLALKTVFEDRMVGGESVIAYRSESRWRLQQEANLTAKLSHPGVPPVHSAGELPDGRPYFCMRLIEGETFASMLQREPAELTKHLRILAQVAQILSAAHQQQIIHRDVKPGNVMVGKYGEVQLMDWGMAKQLTSDSPALGQAAAPRRESLPVHPDGMCDTVDLIPDRSLPSIELNSSIAIEGDSTSRVAVLGTLAYMPPEQAHGLTGIHNCSTDVFALGGMLCQILTGKPPYYGDTSREVWKKACDADLAETFTAIRSSAADQELKELAFSCLASEQELRPRDASAVASALQAYFESVEKRIEVAKIERAQALTQAEAERIRAALELGRRRIAVALCCSLVALITIAATFWYVTESQRAQARLAQTQNDIDRCKSLVQALLVAAPEGVPYAIESLRPLAHHAQAILDETAANTSLPTVQRLHAAVALSHFSKSNYPLIVSSLEDAAVAELPNMVAAFQYDLQEARKLLREAVYPLGDEASLTTRHARIAMLLLLLGDDSMAVEITSKPDATRARLLLIQALRDWRGDLQPLADYLRRSDKPYSRAVVCQALGARDIPLGEEQTWQQLLSQIAASDPNAYLHSAVTFLAIQWKLQLEPIVPLNRTDMQWKITPSGLTMVAVPPGKFVRQLTGGETQELEVTRSLWVLDRELPADIWKQFLKAFPAAEGTRVLPRDSHPDSPIARGTSWDDGFNFCNWLSTKDGLEPCYSIVIVENERENMWKWNRSANGYRLPTEIEWEWAARVNFSHAPLTVNEVSEFVVFGMPEPNPSASRLPNRWGLFDGHGNLHEWCFDNYVDPPLAVVNYDAPTGSPRQVVRGGSFRYSPGNYGRELRTFASRSGVYHENTVRIFQNREEPPSESVGSN